MKTLTMKLPYPVSANRYWQSRVAFRKNDETGEEEPFVLTYVSPEAKAFKEEIGWRARAYGIRQPLEGRLEMLIQLFPHRPLDYRKRMREHGELWDDTVQCMDLGNCEKVVSDAMQDIVFVNDKQLWDIHLQRMEPDQEGARMLVTIKQIEVMQPQAALELSPVLEPQFLPPADGGAF